MRLAQGTLPLRRSMLSAKEKYKARTPIHDTFTGAILSVHPRCNELQPAPCAAPLALALALALARSHALAHLSIHRCVVRSWHFPKRTGIVNRTPVIWGLRWKQKEWATPGFEQISSPTPPKKTAHNTSTRSIA